MPVVDLLLRGPAAALSRRSMLWGFSVERRAGWRVGKLGDRGVDAELSAPGVKYRTLDSSEKYVEYADGAYSMDDVREGGSSRMISRTVLVRCDSSRPPTPLIRMSGRRRTGVRGVFSSMLPLALGGIRSFGGSTYGVIWVTGFGDFSECFEELSTGSVVPSCHPVDDPLASISCGSCGSCFSLTS